MKIGWITIVLIILTLICVGIGIYDISQSISLNKACTYSALETLTPPHPFSNLTEEEFASNFVTDDEFRNVFYDVTQTWYDMQESWWNNYSDCLTSAQVIFRDGISWIRSAIIFLFLSILSFKFEKRLVKK